MLSSSTDDHLWVVILAGGVGSRFWPVSTPDRPKQLLPLGSERPLLADTVTRILPLVPGERLRILTGESLADPILEVVPGLGREHLLLEPRARGTAPVLGWAAAELVKDDPDAILISLHADHVIEPGSEFRGLLAEIGRHAAVTDHLYTIGIEPTRPDTGYGYIQVGDQIATEPDLFEAIDFVEKPDPDTAREYLHRGGYLWNSGIFVWRAATLLEELRRHTPEIGELLPLIEDGRVDEFFDRAPSLSIDEGLLERSDRVAVARAAFHWDDVGTWDAVARTREVDSRGNVGVGDHHLVDCEGCIAWAEEGSVVVFGARDLVVVRTGETTFVAPREKTAELKELLRQLPESVLRPENQCPTCD